MDYSVLEQFIRYLQAGRAYNLKEATNLYEEEQHRGRLETIQKATLEATTNIADSSERTAQTAKENSETLQDIEKLLRKGNKKFVANLLKIK